MRQYAVLAAVVTILSQASPLVAQEPLRAQDLLRNSQPVPVVHLHRHVSIRRAALGALIGGAAGAAVGYGLGSRCGTMCSPEERAGYGRLGAVVLGGVGVFLGVHIAVGNP